jgi:hypothetical protein
MVLQLALGGLGASCVCGAMSYLGWTMLGDAFYVLESAALSMTMVRFVYCNSQANLWLSWDSVW